MATKLFGERWTHGDGGTPILAIQTSASAAAVSNGQYTPLQVDETGQLRVAASVSLGANQSVNVSQVGGQTAATGGAGILQVSLGGTSTVVLASGAATIGALTANQSINAAQIGGQTAATAGAGILSVGINSAGNSVNISQIGGNTAATGGAGILSINNQLLAGQAIATGGTGIQQVASNVNQIGGQTVATGGTGRQLISVDLFQVGGTATVTASAGIVRTHSIMSDDVATIYSSGAAKKPTFLQISASASGSNVLVASAASTSYVILAYNLMANGAVNAQFLSSATPMGGIVYCPTAGVGKVAPYSPVGWMQTTAGHSLNINLSANIAVGGEIVYIAI